MGALESELMINKDSDLQQIQTDYHYLTVNGHELCIMDFIVSVEIFAIQAGLRLTHSLLLPLCSLQSKLVVASLLSYSSTVTEAPGAGLAVLGALGQQWLTLLVLLTRLWSLIYSQVKLCILTNTPPLV